MDTAHYARMFQALADETRVKIMTVLTTEKCCACQILRGLNVSQPTLSHHMGVLCRTGLVRAEKRGKWVFYGIDPEVRADLGAFFTAATGTAEPCDACGDGA